MASRLDRAITEGVWRIGRALGTRPTWCDFAVPGRTAGSTECISAFVAAQLGPIPEGRALAARVIASIAAQPRDSGGWGYREDVPADCDSTAWVLLAAVAAGVDLPSQTVARAADFIAAHQDPSGGFVTYGPDAGRLLTPADQPGWFEPEISVTSSALLALAATGRTGQDQLHAGREYLIERCVGGLWTSYWWAGFGYATDLALSALAAVARVDGTAPAAPAATERAIIARHRPGGGWGNSDGQADNAFSTAFALRTLLHIVGDLAERDAIAHSLSWLVGLREPADAEMLAPGAGSDGDLLLRDCGTVTTAAVVRTLHESRTRLTGTA